MLRIASPTATMPFRPLVRLITLLASVGVGAVGLRLLADDSLHGLVLGFGCMVISFSGVVVSVFRIPVFGEPQPESGFGIFGGTPAKKPQNPSNKK